MTLCRRLIFSLCIALPIALVACKKNETPPPSSDSSSSSSSTAPLPAQIDACALITKEEIQEIQGSAVAETKNSQTPDGAFRSSQCYYGTEEPSRSVSLAVTQSSNGKRSPKDFWRETFGRVAGEEKEPEGDKEKRESARAQTRGSDEVERESTPPRKIEGIGEAAYWVGNRVGGALYVLQKEVFIRISVGGPDNEEAKINKSTTLARKALSRL